ncbi:hypothetical protein RF11_07322 [Thelohanellus kitauei]|uniref:UspA domain-containing protein n=1 Tax=Thelohanellus kitauei TaxID=669202 RepID=A0A0C2MU59_THEKT|nr:hypothetical protein RF11_07322 [Thelohanellus kitauei]
MAKKPTESRVVLIVLDKRLEFSLALLDNFFKNYYRPDDIIVSMIVFDYHKIHGEHIFVGKDDDENEENWKSYFNVMRTKMLQLLDSCRLFFEERNVPSTKVNTVFKEVQENLAFCVCESALEINPHILFMGRKKNEKGKIAIDKNISYIYNHNKTPMIIVTL